MKIIDDIILQWTKDYTMLWLTILHNILQKNIHLIASSFSEQFEYAFVKRKPTRKMLKRE